jgi:hypothetical protein
MGPKPKKTEEEKAAEKAAKEAAKAEKEAAKKAKADAKAAAKSSKPTKKKEEKKVAEPDGTKSTKASDEQNESPGKIEVSDGKARKLNDGTAGISPPKRKRN